MSDFFKEMTSRMRSPFFFSFVFSWTVYNWKIPLSIILYDTEDLKQLGYRSHFDFIEQFRNWDSYVVPLIFAFIYTALSPGIKALSTIVQAWFKKIADKKVRGMYPTSWLPMEVFLRRQDAFQKQQEFLNGLLANETKINTELQEKTNYNNSLLKENSELKARIASSYDKLQAISKELDRVKTFADDRNSLEHMNGFWKIEIGPPANYKDGKIRTFLALIVNGNVAIADSNSPLYPNTSKLENVFFLPTEEVVLIFSEIAFIPSIAKYSCLLSELEIKQLSLHTSNLRCIFTRTEFSEDLRGILMRSIRED